MEHQRKIIKRIISIIAPLLSLLWTETPLFAAPAAISPGSMQQLRADGVTPVSVGATLNETALIFSAPIQDTTVGHTVKLQVEVRATGSANFSCTTFSPSPVAWSTAGGSACVESALISAPTAAVATVTVNTFVTQTAVAGYHWRARAVDHLGAASPWSCFGNNADASTQCSGGGFNPDASPAADFIIAHPLPPTNLRQIDMSANGVIPVGAVINGTTVVFSAVNSDTDPSHTAQIQVEVRPTTTTVFSCSTFLNTAASYVWGGTSTCIQTNVPAASGAVSSVTLTNLTNNTYHWRARLVDNTGSISSWVCFGGNQEFNLNGTYCPGGGASNTTGVTPASDFEIAHPPSIAPNALVQMQTNGIILSVGASSSESTLHFSGINTDPTHPAKIQVEVQTNGTFVSFSCSTFSNSATVSWNGSQACMEAPVFASPGATSSVTLTNLTASSLHWRARLIDNTGAIGPWSCFGGNGEYPSSSVCPGGGATSGSFNATADLTIVHPPPPDVNTMRQFKSDGVTPILAGGSTTESVVVFSAANPDIVSGHTVRLQVEVRPISAYPFSCSTFTAADINNAISWPSPGATQICMQSNALTSNGTLTLTLNTLPGQSYHWRARLIDNTGAIGPWWSCFGDNAENFSGTYCVGGGGGTNGGFAPAADFIVSSGSISPPPGSPAALTQKTTTGSSIGIGATTTESAVVLGGTITDPDANPVRIQVEVQPVGTAFTGCVGFSADGGAPPCVEGSVATPSGGSPSVTVSGLANNANFHWRARGIDSTGSPGCWQVFPNTSNTCNGSNSDTGANGGNNDSPTPADPDFRSANQAPNIPANDANFNQYKLDGTTAITQTTNETSVVFKGLISDPDAHDVRLAVEVVQASGTFSGNATAVGNLVPSGSVASVTVTGLNGDPGGNAHQYKWQIWAIDKTGQAGLKRSFPTPTYGDGTYSFRIVNPNPSVTLLTQSTALSDGGITLGGTLSDPDSQTVKLQVEIRPVGGSYSCSSFTPLGGNIPWNSAGGFACGETLLAAGGATTIPFVNLPNGAYKWRARAVDLYGQPPNVGAGAWLYYPNSGSDPDAAVFTVSNSAPTLSLSTPTNGQFTTGSVAIAVGGTTTESSVLFKGTATDSDAGQQVRIQVEARAIGAGFGCVSFSPPTPNCSESSLVNSGIVASVPLDLLDNGSYHWRARAVDSQNSATAWVCFGGNNDNVADCPTGATSGAPAADFVVAHTTLAALTQAGASSGTVSAGNATGDENMILGGTLGDSASHNVKLQIEVRPASLPFSDPTACLSFETLSPATSACAESPLSPVGTVTRNFLFTNGTYHWRARTVDQNGVAGEWIDAPAVSGVSFEISHPWPVSQSSMTQFTSDGIGCLATSIPAGGTLGATAICLKGDIGDINAPAHTVKLQVEVQPVGTPFTGRPNAESAASAIAAATTLSVSFPYLIEGIDYRWQARAVDSVGKRGRWQTAAESGGYAFRAQNGAPNPPAALSQAMVNNVVSIPLAGTLRDNLLILRGTISDPDGTNVRLWVEARPTGTGFSCSSPLDFLESPSIAPCGAGPLLPSGATAGVILSGLANNDYHWRARTVDVNGAMSPWVCFGGNNDNVADCPTGATSGSPAADFTIANRTPNPLAPADLSQYKKDGATLIPAGGTTNDGELYLQIKATEPDYHSVKIQIEIEPTGGTFNCVVFSPPTAQCKESLLMPPSALDLSSNKNNGLFNQGANTNILLGNTGKFGSGADFTGVGGNIAVPASTTLDTPGASATFELWVKFNALSTTPQTLLEKLDASGGTISYLLQASPPGRAAGQIRFTAGVPGAGPTFDGNVVTIVSNNVLVANVWTHLAVVYNGTPAGSKIYIDGVDQTNGTPTGSGGALPVSAVGPLQIGAGRVEGPNLVLNPGFELISVCTSICLPASWTTMTNYIDPIQYFRDGVVTSFFTHTGTYFLLFPPGTNPPSITDHADLSAWARQTVAVTPNTTYRLSGWVIRDLSAAGVTAVLDLNGLPEGCSAASTATTGTGVWEPLTCYFTTGQNTASVTVQARVARPTINSGYVYFDDLSLVPLSTGSANLLNGSIDDLRISNNLRYTAPFSPPAASFVSDANTVALYPFEDWSVTQKFLAGGLANGSYIWRARGVDLYDAATPWTAAPVDGSGNAFVINNNPPNAPATEQFLKNGTTVLPEGGSTPDSIVILGLATAATLSDPDPNQSLKLQVEVRPLSVPFSCAINGYTVSDLPSPSTPCVESPLLPSGSALLPGEFTYTSPVNDSYHWRATVVDQYGASVPLSTRNFSIAHPASPAGLIQRDNLDLLAVGAATPTGAVQLGGNIYDTDTGHTIGIQAEVRPVGTPFSCTIFLLGAPTQPCQQSASATFLTPTPTTLLFQLPNGSYYWRVRSIDNNGTASPWVNAPVDGFGASFVINNQPPTALNLSALQQRNFGDTTSFAAGGTTNEAGVLFKANVADPLGEATQLRVEARTVGTPINSCSAFATWNTITAIVTNCAEGGFFYATLLDSGGSLPLNHGSAHGGVRMAEPGIFSTGARFNGIDGALTALTTPTLESIGAAATFELWARFNTLTAGVPQTLLEKKALAGTPVSYLLEASPGGSAGQLRFTAGSGGDVITILSNTTAVTAGIWQHIAVVYNGGSPASSKIYVNGADQTLSVSGAGGPLPASPDGIFKIGGGTLFGANLVKDPGFEPFVTNWLNSGPFSTTTQPHSGSYSHRFSGASLTETATQAIPVAPETPYHLSGWIYSQLTAGTATIDLSGLPEGCVATANGAILNSWQKVECRFITGPATSTVTLRLMVTRPVINTDNVYFDDIVLSPLAPAATLNGSVDEIRISNVTRYTAPFVSPAAPFSSDANTLALYHLDNWETAVGVVIPNLPGNGDYHWRVRALDRWGAAQSVWSCFGGNNDTSSGNGCNGSSPDGIDIVVKHPPAPTGLAQIRTDQTAIGIGQNVNQTSLYLQANRIDSNTTHAALKLEFEVKPLSQPFDGGGLIETATAPPSVGQVFLSGLANDTYHWRVRATETPIIGTTYVGEWAYPGGADGAHFIVATTVNPNNALYPSGLCPSPSPCPASSGLFAGSGTATQKTPANALDTDDGTTSYVALTPLTTPIVYMNFDPPSASWSNYIIGGIQLHVKDLSATNQKAAPTLNTWITSGGSLPSPTYVKYTWVSASGESSPSAPLTLSPPSGWYARVAVPPFPVGITAAKIYASGTLDSEVLQGTISVSGGTFDLISLATGTASPPQGRTYTMGFRLGGQDYFDQNDHVAGASAIFGQYPLVNGDYWTTNPGTGLPWSWSDIANLAGVIKNTQSVSDDEIRISQLYLTLDLVATMILTNPVESGYAVDGVNPDAGPATTTYVYKVDYTHFKNIAPTGVRVHIDGDSTGIAMSLDTSAADATLRNGIYSDGEQYLYAATLPAGMHNYYYTAGDGAETVRWPKTGVISKPIVDQAAGFFDIFPDNPALQTNDGTTTERQIPLVTCCYSGNDSQPLQDISLDDFQITSVQIYAVFRTAAATTVNFSLGLRVADPSTGVYSSYIETTPHTVSGPTTYASPGLVGANTVYTTNPLTGLAWSWSDIKNLQSYLVWSGSSNLSSYYTQIFARIGISPLSLSYANEVGYGTDGLHPEAGSGTTPYVYKVVYRQLNGIPPAAGYPKIHIDSLPDPTAAPTLSTSCCPFVRAATTLYARYTWVNSLGQETLPSPASSLLVGANNALRVTIPPFPDGMGVVAANVYVSASAGTEKRQAAQITTSGGTWTEPGTQFTTTGASVPATNSTGQVVAMTDSGVGTYTAGRTYTYTPPANSLAAGTSHRYYFDTLDAAASPLACLPSSGGSPCGTTQLSGPAVSLNAFQMVILPNQVSGCCITTWNAASATNLRSDDAGASVSSSNGSSGPNEILYLDMDNPTSVGLFIKSLTIKAKILNNSTTVGASFRLGLRVNGVDYLDNGQTALGTAGTYGAYSGTLLYSNNPATGKPWTWGDIQNLITVVEHTDNTQTLTVSYLYVAVDLTPVQLDYSQEANYAIKGVSPDIGRSTTLFAYKTVYTHLNGVPPKSVRIHIDSDNVGAPTRPNDSGTGTASSNTLTDASKGWTPNQWANFYLLDADWNSFLITSNSATVLTLSAGTPVSGNYAIYSSPTKVNMVLDTGAAPALQNGIYTDGEQYIYTTLLAPGTHDYYFETADGLYTAASTNKNWLPPSTFAGGTVQTGPIVDARAGSLDLHPSQKNLCCVNSPLFTFGGTGDVGQRNPANALDAQDGDLSYAVSTLYGDRIDMDIDDPDLSYRYFYINSVQVIANIRDSGGGASTGVNLGMRVNGLDYSGSGTTLTPNSTTYNLYAGALYPVNPDTGMPWSWQDIDDLVGTVRHDGEEKGAAGVGGLNSLTDASKSWSAGQWTGRTLLDAAGNAFTITGNSATALTVSGTPAGGAYTLYNNNSLYVTELFVRVYYSPVRLSYSPNSGYLDDGIEPNAGLAAATPTPTSFTYRTVYSQAFDIAPTNIRTYIDADLTGLPLSQEITATLLGDGKWDNGEHYTTGTTLPFAAAHSYRFDANDGNDTASLPPLLLLHPSGKTVSVASSGWTFAPAGSQANALDTADADVSTATSSALNDRLYMELDDTSLKNDWTIRSVTLHAAVRAPAGTTFQMGVRLNGVDYLNGSDIAAAAGYAVYSRVINSATPTLNPNTNLPWTWQEINDLKTVLVHTGNANTLFATEIYLSIEGVKSGPVTTINPPQLSFSTESGYLADADPNGKGVEPNSGSEGATFTYKVIYTHPDNIPPNADLPRVYIDSDPTGGLMTLDTGAAAALRDGNYTNGEQYVYTTTSLLAGRHTYTFKVSDGINIVPLPASGNPLSDPFVTSGTSNTLILHPASRSSLSASGWTFNGTGALSELGPDQSLDFCGTPCNNASGDSSYARSVGSNERLYMFLDKTTRTQGTITSVTLKGVARYAGASGSGIQIGLCLSVCKTSDYPAAPTTTNLTSTYATLSSVSFTVNPETNAPWSWSEINQLVAWVHHATNANEIRVTELWAEITTTNAAVFSYSPEGGYITDGVSPDGGKPDTVIRPDCVGANGVCYLYKIVYSHGANLPPDAGYPQVLIDGVPSALLRDVTDLNNNGNYNDDFLLNDPLRDGDFTNGEQYVYRTTLLLAGSHTYSFRAVVGGGGGQTLQCVDMCPGVQTLIGPNTANLIPILTPSPETGYGPTIGVLPTIGLSTGDFVFKIVYIHDDNNPPTSVRLFIDADPTGFPMVKDTAASNAALRDNNYTTPGSGEQYIATLRLAPGTTHTYFFTASDGNTLARFPLIAGTNLSGPTVTDPVGAAGAPGAVTDLKVSSQTPTSVTLRWTAPGNNAASLDGKATAYDLRYSTKEIVDDSAPVVLPWQIKFSQINPAVDPTLDSNYHNRATGLPLPSAGGTLESVTIDNLIPNTAYYIALKSLDETHTDPTSLPISNILNKTSLPSNPLAAATDPPIPITPLLQGFNAISLPLLPAVPGSVESALAGSLGTGLSVYPWTSTGPGIADGSYTPRLMGNDLLTVTEGYFVQAPDAARLLTVTGTVNAAASATLPLLYGFNLIGNPYNREVLLEGIQIRCQGTIAACGGTGDETKSFTAAVTAGWVENGIRLWNGSSYDFGTIVDVQKPVLRLWKGYWLRLLKNDAAYSMVIPKP